MNFIYWKVISFQIRILSRTECKVLNLRNLIMATNLIIFGGENNFDIKYILLVTQVIAIKNMLGVCGYRNCLSDEKW